MQGASGLTVILVIGLAAYMLLTGESRDIAYARCSMGMVGIPNESTDRTVYLRSCMRLAGYEPTGCDIWSNCYGAVSLKARAVDWFNR